MKRARDVRDQLVGLMERVELEMETAPEDHDAIKKASSTLTVMWLRWCFLCRFLCTPIADDGSERGCLSAMVPVMPMH